MALSSVSLPSYSLVVGVVGVTVVILITCREHQDLLGTRQVSQILGSRRQ